MSKSSGSGEPPNPDRRRDDLAVFGQQIDKPRLRADRVDAVNQQDRPRRRPRPAPQHLELERASAQDVGHSRPPTPTLPPLAGEGEVSAACANSLPRWRGRVRVGVFGRRAAHFAAACRASQAVSSRRSAAGPAVAAALPWRQRKALLGLGVGHQALAGHHDDVPDAADPLAEFLDLPCHRIGVAGEHLALADQHLGIEIGRARPPRCAGPPRRRRHLRRQLAGLELRHLRRALDADGQKPGDLLADAQRLLVGVADIGERHVGEAVLARRRHPSLAPRLLVGVEACRVRS